MTDEILDSKFNWSVSSEDFSRHLSKNHRVTFNRLKKTGLSPHDAMFQTSQNLLAKLGDRRHIIEINDSYFALVILGIVKRASLENPPHSSYENGYPD